MNAHSQFLIVNIVERFNLILGGNQMAKICTNCDCLPYSSRCECESQQGITITQPSCQTLPDGAVTGNPCYRPSPENRSYWSYKMLVDNGNTTSPIGAFVIPVCAAMSVELIAVAEKIDGCGTFEFVPFTLSTEDPEFGTAPAGFQWLRVENSGRYGKGIAVEYRLEVIGNFPNGVQPIKVFTSGSTLTFDCEGCFIVHQCPEPADLIVDITCQRTITNNQARLIYQVDVANVGGSPAEDVFLEDVLLYNDSNVTLGAITVEGADLVVDRSQPGDITISGNIGTMNPGDQRLITITVQVAAIQNPGNVSFNNRLSAISEQTQGTDSCVLTVPAVRLRGDKCCIVDNSNLLTYEISITSVGNSPESIVNTRDRLTIPEGVTFQVVTFEQCSLTFGDSGQPVPLNEPIQGGTTLTIACEGVPIPAFGTLTGGITLQILSATFVDSQRTLTNTFNSISPTDPDAQIFLGTENLPVSVDTTIQTSITCEKPCRTDLT